MSYEKIIGFGVNPAHKKGPLLPRTSREKNYLQRMGVEDEYHDIKARMPADNREPEKKIFVNSLHDLARPRQIFLDAPNAFLIPGQSYGLDLENAPEEVKNPLTSLLIDGVSNDPALHAFLDRLNYTLRYRCESDPYQPHITRGDYNEKSGMIGSNIIGGTSDRIERELEQRSGESLEDAYYAFLRKYIRRRDPAMSGSIAFENLHLGAGYQAARNELGIAVRHPHYPVLLVLEGCEDIWHSNGPDMMPIKQAKFFEFEFEPKQLWGKLPEWAQSPEGFQKLVYGMMHGIQSHLHQRIAHSSLNEKSKAELTKEHLAYLFDPAYGLSGEFGSNAAGMSAFAMALKQGLPLGQALAMHEQTIFTHAGRLHGEKLRFNGFAPKPEANLIGFGRGGMIMFDNDNGPAPAWRAA